MGSNLLFWIGIGAAQKSAKSKAIKRTDRRHRVIAMVVGFLLVLFTAAGLIFLFVISSR
jgi:hypothetical protein